MVVANDRHRFDAGRHKEVHEHGLELRLARLEVVAADKRLLPLGELEGARDKGVLRRAVDVGALKASEC